jgi:hypothetical protein
LLLLPLPLALLACTLAIRLDPAHEWRVGYIAAGFAAAPVALAQLGNVARGVRSCPRFRMIGLVLALLVVSMSLLAAEGVGRTQAQAYEDRGAYALALRFFAASGEPANQLASDSFRVHEEWAQAALGIHGYATATTQLRAAILLDPGSDFATQQIRVLSKVTLDWGEALVGSGQYQQAVQVYTDAAAFATYDSACQSHLHATLAAAYVAWANSLLLSGDTAGAVAKLQVVSRDYADTPSAQTADTGLREIPAEQALRGALSAGTHNDAGAMDTQLRGLIAKYPASAAAVAASKTPQPVTGVVADQSGASVAGVHHNLHRMPRGLQPQRRNAAPICD